MRRAVQSWAVVAGLLGAGIVAGEGASGCLIKVPDDLLRENAGGSGQSSGNGDATTPTTTVTGTAESSASAGSGGHDAGNLEQSFVENDEDIFAPALDSDNPITIFPGQVVNIRGLIDTSQAPEDNDKFSIHLAEDAVLRFETFNPSVDGQGNRNDPGCQEIDLGIQWEGESPYKFEQGSSDSQDADIGIGNCAAMTYHLAKDAKYNLIISSKSLDQSHSSYLVRIKSLPIVLEDSIDKSKFLIADADFGNNDEVTIAIAGFVSPTKADKFNINLTNKSVRAEVIEGMLRPDFSCEDSDYALVLKWSGVQKVEDETGGRGHCPMLDGFGPMPKASQAAHVSGLASVIVATKADGAVTPYTLVVTARSE